RTSVPRSHDTNIPAEWNRMDLLTHDYPARRARAKCLARSRRLGWNTRCSRIAFVRWCENLFPHFSSRESLPAHAGCIVLLCFFAMLLPGCLGPRQTPPAVDADKLSDDGF